MTLKSNGPLYGVTYALLLALLYGMHRLVRSPFGLALRAIKSDPGRMAALGYPALRYRLAAYVLSALVCALAGVLLANLTLYMSPSYLKWQLSGELVMMIVLGGMAFVIGPLYGAIALLVIEEVLASVNLNLPWNLGAIMHDHPMVVVGIFIVLVAIGPEGGLRGGLGGRGRRAKPARESVAAGPGEKREVPTC